MNESHIEPTETIHTEVQPSKKFIVGPNDIACERPRHKLFKDDLSGRRYSRLFVIGFYGKRVDTRRRQFYLWRCLCDCGNEICVKGNSLKTGNTTSCGCFHREDSSKRITALSTTHGQSGTSEYKSWKEMIFRCTNKKFIEWMYYGGKGIKVCDRWRNSFEDFLMDLGPKPAPHYSIDRFPDVSGNYEPGNCRWATSIQQNRNRSDNRIITYNGESMCQSEWEEKLSIPHSMLQSRLSGGWPIEKAFTTPKSNQSHYITFQGQSKRISHWAKEVGLHPCVILSRIIKGWTVEKALTERVRSNAGKKDMNQPKNSKTNIWKMDDGSCMQLLTVPELRSLPPETVVMNVIGETRSVVEPNEPPPDEDERYGYSAWGIAPTNQIKS